MLKATDTPQLHRAGGNSRRDIRLRRCRAVGLDVIAGALEAFYGALLDDDAEQLYERAPCGYLSTTPDGVIIKVNQTFLTLTGYTGTDLVGRRTFADLLTVGGRIYHETHYAPMLRMQGTAREIALEIVRGDGRRLRSWSTRPNAKRLGHRCDPTRGLRRNRARESQESLRAKHRAEVESRATARPNTHPL